ncbi:MAG: ATP-dependent helicase, partial [Oscillospiraceae bacterium]|nr:ATP-dependent helicase [Oscillospiraceae bacterium]
MRFEPYPYQQYCIERIIGDAALGLFLDMGLGKTVITLTAINALRYDRWAVRRVLVVAPKKVAEGTWSREAGKWEHLSRLRVSPVCGSQQRRLRALAAPADVYV